MRWNMVHLVFQLLDLEKMGSDALAKSWHIFFHFLSETSNLLGICESISSDMTLFESFDFWHSWGGTYLSLSLSFQLGFLSLHSQSWSFHPLSIFQSWLPPCPSSLNDNLHLGCLRSLPFHYKRPGIWIHPNYIPETHNIDTSSKSSYENFRQNVKWCHILSMFLFLSWYFAIYSLVSLYVRGET